MTRSLESSKQKAESLAIQAFTFIAADDARVAAFLAASGIALENLRAAARDRSFLQGVLDFLATDEALLVAFADHAAVAPVEVTRARDALDGRSGAFCP